MDVFNPVLLGKLLDLAGHPNTGDHEALNALRKAQELIKRKEWTLGAIACNLPSGEYLSLRAIPHDAILKKLSAMTLERDQAVRGVKKLRRDNKALIEKVADQDEKLTASNAKYGRACQLLSQARRRPVLARVARLAISAPTEPETPVMADPADLAPVGTYHRLRHDILARRDVGTFWRDLFMRETGTDRKVMDYWKRTNVVPKWAVDVVPKLNVEGYTNPNTRRHIRNATSKSREAIRFNELLQSGLFYYEIAARMSKEFGVQYTVAEITERFEVPQAA